MEELDWPAQTEKPISLWSQHTHRQCHVETGKDQTQTVATKLEEHYCLKYHCHLNASAFQIPLHWN